MSRPDPVRTTAAGPVRVATPADLGPAAIRAVADGARVELTVGLVDRLGDSRSATLEALRSLGAAAPVYGVTTGMGSQAHLAVGAEEQPAFQDDLMLGRSVGTAPWLGRREVRAALVTRLRTLLEPEVGASPGLAQALAAVLADDLHPAVPAAGNGAAGEIIPLAHLGAFLTGAGDGIDAAGSVRPAGELLGDAGLAPYGFGAREGVAFLQGVPVATGRAVLLAADARLLARQVLCLAAADIAAVRAPRDPYAAALARGDDELAVVLRELRALAGEEPAPRMLQAPVSFRVVGPALAALTRAVAGLEAAADRALVGVTTSPALVDGRFLGTAGFDGFDLAASADGVRVAVVHAAEVGTARLHRMLDAGVTGSTPQLSPQPGRQAGLVALHKRAVGLVHHARRQAAPAALGASETSLGHEDVQSFALEAVQALAEDLQVLRDVTATQLVAAHRFWQLEGTPPRCSDGLGWVLQQAFRLLPDVADDRPTGRDVAVLRDLLALGWSQDVFDQPSAASPPPLLRPE